MNDMQQNEATRRQTSGAPIGKTIGQTGEEQAEASRSANPAQPEAQSPSIPGNTQSSASLSRNAEDDDGRFQVAEEVNLDEQSDGAHRMGHMPQDSGQVRPAEAMSEAMRPPSPQTGTSKDELQQSMDRAVPPSDAASD